MKQDQKSAIRQVCDFLGVKLTDKKVSNVKDIINQFNVFQKVDGLLKHLAFDNMKKNQAVNPFASDIKPTGMRGHFVREGKVTHTQLFLITRCVQI